MVDMLRCFNTFPSSTHAHSLILPPAEFSTASTSTPLTDPLPPLDDPDDSSLLNLFPYPLPPSHPDDTLWDRLQLATSERPLQPIPNEDPGTFLQNPWGQTSACSASPSLAAQTPPAKPSGVVRIHSRQAHARSDKPVEITLELLSCHFHESLEVAAAKIGIGKSTMKLVCRQLGVRRWPYRHVGTRAGRLYLVD